MLPQAIFVAGSLSNNFPSAGNAGLTWHQSFNATYYRPLGGADQKYIYIHRMHLGSLVPTDMFCHNVHGDIYIYISIQTCKLYIPVHQPKQLERYLFTDHKQYVYA